MLERFAAGSAIASMVIALAALALRLNPMSNLESRYLLTSIWCAVPLVWGLWAMITPTRWLPQRLPVWGAILGVIAGLVGVFVWNIPSRMSGEPLPSYLGGLAVLVIVVFYYLLWILVRVVYRRLAAPPSAG